MTKNEVIQKIKEIIAKDSFFKDASIQVIFKKKNEVKNTQVNNS